MDYSNVRFLPEAYQEFRSVPFPFRRQINERIMALRKGLPPEAQPISEGKYRLLVHGWEILIVAESDVIWIAAIRPRSA